MVWPDEDKTKAQLISELVGLRQHLARLEVQPLASEPIHHQIQLAHQLRTVADISEQINVILDPKRLLQSVVTLVQTRLHLYHVHVYLLDDNNQELIMQAGSGEVGRRLRRRGHKIRLDHEQSMVAQAARRRETVVVNDVSQAANFLPNPLLPETRSEVAMPLIARDRVLGVFDVQDDRPDRFSQIDLDIFSTLSRQIAIALDNAQLYTKLEAANKELEAFTYSVSHDLRAPLRAINGFSQILQQEFAADLPAKAGHCLARVVDNTRQMTALIDDLLRLSQLGRQALKKESVDPAKLAGEILASLTPEHERRQVEFITGQLPVCQADPALLKQVFLNLLSNALKYTRPRAVARIEIGWQALDGRPVYFVRDNGVGFDMSYAGRLFGPFQRLHRSEEYEGTGIGLAIVQRVIQRHGGQVWAEAEVDKGATFYFTI